MARHFSSSLSLRMERRTTLKMATIPSDGGMERRAKFQDGRPAYGDCLLVVEGTRWTRRRWCRHNYRRICCITANRRCWGGVEGEAAAAAAVVGLGISMCG